MSDITPATADRRPGALVVRGARTHNLKGVDVSLAHRHLIVITGVSGSGKSSLAFDTIYAEGQRRYVESLSAYARQFLERMEKPDVDSIEGIAPAIAIRQKNSIRNPRSTVGTTTEIHDYLRLLWARVGRTLCRQCGREVERDDDQGTGAPGAEDMFDAMVDADPRGASGDPVLVAIDALRRRGFGRLLLGGRAVSVDEAAAAVDQWRGA